MFFLYSDLPCHLDDGEVAWFNARGWPARIEAAGCRSVRTVALTCLIMRCFTPASVPLPAYQAMGRRRRPNGDAIEPDMSGFVALHQNLKSKLAPWPRCRHCETPEGRTERPSIRGSRRRPAADSTARSEPRGELGSLTSGTQ